MSKPQTFHKVIFTDGSFVKIIHNLDPEPGERIIARIGWAHGSGTWPMEIIAATLASLPAEAQKRIVGEILTEPSVTRRVELTTRRPKSKP